MCWGYKKGNKQSNKHSSNHFQIIVCLFWFAKAWQLAWSQHTILETYRLGIQMAREALCCRCLFMWGHPLEVSQGRKRSRKWYLHVGEWPRVLLNSFLCCFVDSWNTLPHVSFLEDWIWVQVRSYGDKVVLGSFLCLEFNKKTDGNSRAGFTFLEGPLTYKCFTCMLLLSWIPQAELHPPQSSSLKFWGSRDSG